MTTTANTIGGAATATTAPLPVASTIDATQDYVAIYTASAAATQAINRNTFLNLSSQPLGLTDTQSPTNKTFNNTNALTIKDGNLTIQNSSDTTKQATFSLSGITTGATRTYTLPNFSATLATLSGTETFTNKTLTSPTINSPTIVNATITADTVSGYTVSNNGTIYGMSVTGGILASAALLNTINTAAIQTNAVAAANLATNAITLGYVQITSGFSTSSTTAVQVTGLSVTVTIPAGGRRIRITAYARDLITTGGAAFMHFNIWDGTVGTGTQIADTQGFGSAATQSNPACCIAVASPGAGTKTYNVGAFVSANGMSVECSSIAPAFILVEAI